MSKAGVTIADGQEVAADFVERFAAWWRQPDLARTDLLLADEVRLVQPLVPPSEGRGAAIREFERLFALIPDLRATVHRWAADGDIVFIEFTLHGTLGGKPLSWGAVDRFLLRDGLAVERVAYFDSAPLAVQLALRPRSWPQVARARFRPVLQARPSTEAP